MKVLCVYRDERYSPNSVEKDQAILQAVAQQLQGMGHDLSFVSEACLERVEADACLTMARSQRALEVLRESGVRCVNVSEGIQLCCHRKVLDALMRREHIMMPPLTGTDGYWLKRGDGSAEKQQDIVFCADEKQLAEARQQMTARGITEQVVSAHVVGDLVKFYGVSGTDFFRCYYPSDDGMTKFGDEARNGQAHHYPYDVNLLREEAERLARLAQVAVYGGDAIVTAEGRLAIIDFNDWPSFSRCREEAAVAIAQLVIRE